MVEKAALEELDSGVAPVTDGWFVVNVPDAAWLTSDAFGARCVFEGDAPVLRRRPDLPVHKFHDVGFTLQVVRPGQPSGLYHGESNQEDFLVLAGECLLLVEGEGGRSERGTSCTARRAPSTPSSAPETVRASSSWRADEPWRERSSIRASNWPAATAQASRRRRSCPPKRMRRSRTGSPGGRIPGTDCPGPSTDGVLRRRPSARHEALVREPETGERESRSDGGDHEDRDARRRELEEVPHAGECQYDEVEAAERGAQR